MNQQEALQVQGFGWTMSEHGLTNIDLFTNVLLSASDSHPPLCQYAQ